VKIEVLTEVTPTNTGVNKDVGEDSDLPHDLTTFKLSLGQQEREARSQLVLPYLRYVTFYTNLDICDLINPRTLEPTGSAQKKKTQRPSTGHGLSHFYHPSYYLFTFFLSSK
jgi:hypothetical protein